jgi:hypothetical protein
MMTMTAARHEMGQTAMTAMTTAKWKNNCDHKGMVVAVVTVAGMMVEKQQRWQ